jgi:branched-chain amino acid aminotransferase
MTIAVADLGRPELADGVAFIDGEYIPVASAKISILDWGFMKSDVTYDVVHVWKGRFFRLQHHLDRFERSVAGLRLKLPQRDRRDPAPIGAAERTSRRLC